MILQHAQRIWQSETLRKKILFTLGVVVVYKFLGSIPVPGVDTAQLVAIQDFLQSNQGLQFFSSLMGGGLERFSLVLMGLSPYINAVIILQLLAVIVPQLEALKKEGEQGQRKMQSYTRWLTLPLAIAQSYGMIVLFNTIVGSSGGGSLIDTSDFWGTMLPAMLVITAGTMLLVWLGDLISESGIGNGSSIVIFAGVLAAVPENIISYISAQSYGVLLLLTAMTVVATYVIIRFTEGSRKIPLIYARTGKEEKSYFPIRVNQAGMIPIIFAVSLVTFPELIGRLLAVRTAGTSQMIGEWLTANLSMQNPSWYLIIGYALLVIGFSYFYLSIVFNTTEVAESIQKRGGYIPAVRPGKETAQYLEKVSNHLNLFGGSFLALIAVFPYLITKLNNQFQFIDTVGASGQLDFLIPGAGLIIVVGVVLDLIRRVDTEMKSYDYKKFL